MTEKIKTYKLTQKDFQYFKERVYFWQNALGATHVTIYVEFKKNSNKHNSASYEKWSDTGTVKIWLNTSLTVEPTKEEIDVSAFHEVFEAIYLCDLRHLAKASWSNFEVEQATHGSVMRACNTIFKAMRGY